MNSNHMPLACLKCLSRTVRLFYSCCQPQVAPVAESATKCMHGYSYSHSSTVMRVESLFIVMCLETPNDEERIGIKLRSFEQPEVYYDL